LQSFQDRLFPEFGRHARFGTTALHFAIYRFRRESALLLICQGAQNTVHDCYGQTAFDWTITTKNKSLDLSDLLGTARQTDPISQQNILKRSIYRIAE
jgi:ankyrin repeat protein